VGGNDDDVIQLPSAGITVEEMIAFRFESGAIRRATAVNASNLLAPVWGAASEIGQNFSALRFRYYDSAGQELAPPVSILAHRLRIARIDVQAVAQTAEPLSDGARRSFALGLSSAPRHVRTR
jgi:hypothetical protein